MMISRENATVSASLACLALIAMLLGQWMTRPAHMGLLGSMVAVIVICVIVAGSPQVLIFGAALSCAKQGRMPASGWWTAVYLVFVMQFGAGVTFIAGSILGEDRLLPVAAAVLVAAALVAVASGLVASRLAHPQTEQARDALGKA